MQTEVKVRLSAGPAVHHQRRHPQRDLLPAGSPGVQDHRHDTTAVWTAVCKLTQQTAVHLNLGNRPPSPAAARGLAILMEVFWRANHDDVLTPFNARLLPSHRAPVLPYLRLAVGFKVQGEALVLYELGKFSELVVEFPVGDATLGTVAYEHTLLVKFITSYKQKEEKSDGK